MAKFGRQGMTGSFITEMVLILAIILASKVSQVRMEPSTQEYCPNIRSITNDNGTCVASDHCSKFICTAPPDNTGPFSRMSVQALVCNQSVKANVSLESPSVKWSHIFEDGEKVALPDAMKPDDAPPNVKQFLIVVLMKNDPYIHFKIVLKFDMGFMNYNTSLLEGDLDAAECESHATELPIPTIAGGDDYEHRGSHDENCPDIQLPDGSDGTCVLDDHCSKVTCTSPPDSTGPFNHVVLTVQAYGCGHQPMKAEVSLKSSSVKWSHTFKDGERAAMPDSMKPPDVPDDMKIFLEVELKKNGGKVHFKLLLLFESEFASYNVTFLEGDLHASKCVDNHLKQCSAVNFMPSVSQDEKDPDSTVQCVFSNQCSKVTCVAESGGNKLTVGFEVKKCGQSLISKVTLKHPDDLDWSHSLGDGEKAKIPITPGSFTGQQPVSDASLFMQVRLQELKGNSVNFTVAIVGQETTDGKVNPVKFVLLEGESAISTDECGSWFSRQSNGVKATVIIIPLLSVILLVLVLTFICYKKRQDGKRVMVNIFPGRDKIGMQRLSNEI